MTHVRGIVELPADPIAALRNVKLRDDFPSLGVTGFGLMLANLYAELGAVGRWRRARKTLPTYVLTPRLATRFPHAARTLAQWTGDGRL